MWPILAVILSFAISGVVSGIWTNRWVDSTVLKEAVQSTQLPPTVGEWDGREEVVSPAELKASQASAIVRRAYVNRKTGNSVSVVLICGHAGPVSVHTPDVCFPGSGFVEVGKASMLNLDEPSGRAQFCVRTFQKASSIPVNLVVHYAWNAGKGWQAPENPRMAFAGQPALFKLYVTREAGADSLAGAKDPAENLIRELI